MRLFAIAPLLLASFLGLGAAQKNPKAESKYDVQRCAPKVISHAAS